MQTLVSTAFEHGDYHFTLKILVSKAAVVGLNNGYTVAALFN